MITSFPAVPKHTIRLEQCTLSLCAGTAVIWFGWKTLQGIDPAVFWAAFDSIAVWQWCAAAICIWISFAAVGRYDAVWHGIFQTGVPPRLARHVGTCSVAIGQTIGMGAVKGGLVRWQCLPQLTAKQTAQISAAVALSFLTAWTGFAVLSAAVLGLLPLTVLLAGIAVVTPLIRTALRKLAWMSGRDMVKLAVLTGVDLLFAGTALYILMPSGTAIDYHILISAFVLALGFGLIANIPAGAGVLEVTLITFLAPSDAAPIVAGLLAFRLVGYIAPAILAMIYAARLKLAPAKPKPHTAGDWDIVQQHGALVHRNGATWLMGYPLGLPVTIGASTVDAPPPYVFGRYKIDKASALQLRRMGWQVGRIALDAIITPQTWTPSGREFSGLRRKLAKAKAAGVTITDTPSVLPITDMTRIARCWAKDHGGERGFSMGRFTPSYVANQRVFIIEYAGKPVGFITFQCHGRHWQLDLVRHSTDIPDGAMHLAIATAITAAKDARAKQFSLAAVSDSHLAFGDYLGTKCKGLTQFKNSFRPTWVPLYHAAPTRLMFGISLFAVTLAVQRPMSRLTSTFALKLLPRYGTPMFRLVN